MCACVFVGGGRDGRLTGQLHVRAGAVASPAVLVVHGGRVVDGRW